MSDDSSVSWSHTILNAPPVMFVQLGCPCGLEHWVTNAEPGGLVVMDCVCGLTFTAELPLGTPTEEQ